MTTYYAKSFKDLRVYQKGREVSMIEKADSFCGSADGVFREDALESFTADPDH